MLPVTAALSLFCSIALPVAAQDGADPDAFEFKAYWSGARTLGASTQPVHATVEVTADTARIALNNDDWFYFGARCTVPVIRTGDGRLAFKLHYGTPTVGADSTYREVIGNIREGEPAIKLHLKKNLPPRSAPAQIGAVVLPGCAGSRATASRDWPTTIAAPAPREETARPQPLKLKAKTSLRRYEH